MQPSSARQIYESFIQDIKRKPTIIKLLNNY